MSSDDPIRETRLEPTPRDALEEVLFEVKRVIVGQDAMLERLLVALLAGGHVLLEGVPGLAKTLTVKTLAEAVGGRFTRVVLAPVIRFEADTAEALARIQADFRKAILAVKPGAQLPF